LNFILPEKYYLFATSLSVRSCVVATDVVLLRSEEKPLALTAVTSSVFGRIGGSTGRAGNTQGVDEFCLPAPPALGWFTVISLLVPQGEIKEDTDASPSLAGRLSVERWMERV
jgi:hypothetical protein